MSELSELVAKYVSLESLDQDRLVGQCPVCHAKTLKVNVTQQYWACEVCEIGGDARRFKTMIEQVMGL